MQSTWKWLLPTLVALLIVSCGGNPTPAPPADAGSHKTVSMLVHMPDGKVASFPEVPLSQPGKVRDAMVAAVDVYPGFAFTDTLYTGIGHLVTGINGLRNPRGGGAYWQFCIDNVASEVGIDDKPIAPGQSIDWHYAEYGKLPCKKIGE